MSLIDAVLGSRRLRGLVTVRSRSLVIAGLMTVTLSGVAAAQDDPNPGNLTLTAAVDFSNAYMFRGIRQEEDGLIMWPAGDLGIAFFSGDGGLKSAGVNVGVWNSVHSGPSGTDGRGKSWYEGDFYATLGLGFGGGVGFATTYTAYSSPNNAFSTVKEIMFKLSVDDSGYLGKGAVKPYVAIAREIDVEDVGQGQADGGAEAGTYMELGIAPGWAAEAVSLAFPVKVGLSLSNYYESPSGEDGKFGYFSIAGTVTVPLKGVPASYGAWNVHAGVEFQKYGSTLEDLNHAFGLDPDASSKVIVSGGIGLSY